MKDFKEILKQAGITVTDEQLATVETEMKANYKPIADYIKQKEKLDASDEKVKTLTASLDKFKDVDPTALTQTIEDLKGQLTQKDAEFAQRLADRDFDDLINTNINTLKGKNAKAIKALLDVDALKQSKNQAEDIKTALEALQKADDSAFLFETVQPQAQGSFNPIGGISTPPVPSNYLDEQYKNNPYYKKG
jgi:phage minor structural protein GP20|nr:MAG TPA: minor structural protein [Caudoviricetes sp.]